MSAVCTFSKTGRRHVSQPYYHCSTCLLDEAHFGGVCEPCAKTCHAGHDLTGPHTTQKFFCDCVDEGLCRIPVRFPVLPVMSCFCHRGVEHSAWTSGGGDGGGGKEHLHSALLGLMPTHAAHLSTALPAHGCPVLQGRPQRAATPRAPVPAQDAAELRALFGMLG